MNSAELEQLLASHHRAGFGWALSCCSGNAAEAEDILQMAYLKIVEGKARYDGKSAFKTWLFAVIRKTAAQEYRRRALWWVKLRALKNEAEIESRQPEASPSEGAERSQQAALFRRALAALSGRQREVLQLVFYNDLTIEEAARVMGVSLGSALIHYERGKQELRERMARGRVFDAS